MSADDAAAGAPAYDAVLAVRDAVTKALEEARTAKLIGKPQEAAVRVEVPAELLALVETSGVDMAELCIVSAAELFATDAEEVSCTVEVAAGDKCPRCWNVRDLGADGLCARCHEALAATGEL
jgi:isoleucyl-tRNA synthetase